MFASEASFELHLNKFNPFVFCCSLLLFSEWLLSWYSDFSHCFLTLFMCLGSFRLGISLHLTLWLFFNTWIARRKWYFCIILSPFSRVHYILLSLDPTLFMASVVKTGAVLSSRFHTSNWFDYYYYYRLQKTSEMRCSMRPSEHLLMVLLYYHGLSWIKLKEILPLV